MQEASEGNALNTTARGRRHRRMAVVSLMLVLAAAVLGGCSGGGNDKESTAADEATMTAADKVVCERAYSAFFVPGTSAFASPADIKREWARIAKAGADAHPEFRAKALALQKAVNENVAYYEDHGIADDENIAPVLNDELNEMCADKNYDLDYAN